MALHTRHSECWFLLEQGQMQLMQLLALFLPLVTILSGVLI